MKQSSSPQNFRLDHHHGNANGNILNDSYTITAIKDLKVKDASLFVVKVGAKSKTCACCFGEPFTSSVLIKATRQALYHLKPGHFL